MRQCFSSACPYASSVARRARIKPSTSLQEATPAALRRKMESMGPRHCLIYLATHTVFCPPSKERVTWGFSVRLVKSVRLEKFRKIQSRVPFRKLCQFRS
jgi:hypothetical protein